MHIQERVKQYAYLMRLNKPIGTLLLLWPTLWALWLASTGHPNKIILLIFVIGVVLMRAAGCVVNDIADRNFDGHVGRTCMRPLASGKIKLIEAVLLAMMLGILAFLLVLQCNTLTILLAFIGAVLTVVYPLMKRFTHLPQFGLGLAFTWGVPMAFAAETNQVGSTAWFLFFTGILWPVIYDTMYAMTDREDDKKIGIKSTAILFAGHDKVIIGILQIIFVLMLANVGVLFQLNAIYFLSLLFVSILFGYQQVLIGDRSPTNCLAAFLNNNWVGLIIFLGITLSYYT